MLDKLSLSNMDIFKNLYKENKLNISYDKDFFNTYNKENIFIKYIYRKFVKLIKYKNDYIGFIWYEIPSEKYVKILALYIKDEYKKDINPYFLKELDKHILCYEEYEKRNKKFELNLLGFESIMNTLMMFLDLDTVDLNDSENNLFSNNLFPRIFSEGKDEGLRCILQNEIFYDEDRPSLSIEDIYSDMMQDYYLKNHCYFLMYDDQYIGYGQVIKNRGVYIIVNFGILNKYRKNGFATLFIKYILKKCKEDNIDNVYIRVDENNYGAINLYKKIGFNVIDKVILWQRD